MPQRRAPFFLYPWKDHIVITVKDLADMANNLEQLKIFTQWTTTTLDDTALAVLQVAAGDETVLAALARFLNWASGNTKLHGPDPGLPPALEAVKEDAALWRVYLRSITSDACGPE